MMAARGTFGSDGFHMYRVVVSTGQAAGAGTDSRIFLTMIGAAGQSSEMQLKDSLTGSDSFERGSTDEFALRIKADIGDILRIVLRSDASALGSDWLVSRVVISNCENRNQYTFDCADFWIRDSLPHEFICSHRIKREVQLESVADSSGLLLSARLPIPGKPPPPPSQALLAPACIHAYARGQRRAAGGKRVRRPSRHCRTANADSPRVGAA